MKALANPRTLSPAPDTNLLLCGGCPAGLKHFAADIHEADSVMRETFMNAVMRWSFGGGSEAFIRSVRALMGAGVASALLWSGALAQGTPPGFEGKPLPGYPGQPTDCYLLLKNQWPYVQGGDEPVCWAVLANLNKFCDEPPQYNRRKLHPTTKNLREPVWQELDVKQNLDLVQQTFIAHVLPQYRTDRWEVGEGRQVLERAKSGKLRLYSASISADLRGGVQTVYKLEKVYPPEPVGYDQPFLMFANGGERTPAPLFGLREYAIATLWGFRKGWYLIRFHPDERRFHVEEIIRPQVGPDAPIASTLRCTIQHLNDHHGVK